MILHHSGDLIALAKEGRFDVIAHGCNCFCTMGAGVARSIAQAFPAAAEADAATVRGDRSKLGTTTTATVRLESGQPLDVVNCYTQYQYGRNRMHLDYVALEACLRYLAKRYNGQRIGLPRIGTGLAGGNWDFVEKILFNELVPFAHVTIVTLP